MSCKHTIGTAVDEDGCCISCGADLNHIAIAETKKSEPDPGDAGFWGRACARLCLKNREQRALIERLTAELKAKDDRIEELQGEVDACKAEVVDLIERIKESQK